MGVEPLCGFVCCSKCKSPQNSQPCAPRRFVQGFRSFLLQDHHHEALEKLRSAGLLQPSRLAVLPESSLQGLAELAERGASLPVDEMLKWLTEEKEKAIPLHQIAQAEHVDYYVLLGYRLRLEHEQAKKETRIRHSQSEVQAVRMSRQEPPAWLGPASKLRRTDANDRKAGDQADREK